MNIAMKRLFAYSVPILFLPLLMSADTTGSGDAPTEFPNPFGDGSGGGLRTLTDLLREITNNIILPIGAVIVVLMVIYAGFLFVTAQGNENKITDAKRAFTYAVIGALILLGAWVIANVIKETICALYEEGKAPKGLGCGGELNT